MRKSVHASEVVARVSCSRTSQHILWRRRVSVRLMSDHRSTAIWWGFFVDTTHPPH
jgi:hypothetical protein